MVNGVDDDPDDMEGLQYEYEQCYSKWATHIYQKTPLYDALALVVQQIIDGTTRNRLDSDDKCPSETTNLWSASSITAAYHLTTAQTARMIHFGSADSSLPLSPFMRELLDVPEPLIVPSLS